MPSPESCPELLPFSPGVDAGARLWTSLHLGII